MKDLIDFSSDDERDSFTITHTDSDEGYGQSEQLENVILKGMLGSIAALIVLTRNRVQGTSGCSGW